MMRRPPSYRLHKPSGQAVVTIHGHDHYLGRHGSPESKAEYARLIAEWAAGGSCTAAAPDMSVREAMSFALRYAQTRTEARDLVKVRQAVAVVTKLYGDRRVSEFGPVALKAVRLALAAKGWSRGYVQQLTGFVKRAFKWLVSEELVPEHVYRALGTIGPLPAGVGRATQRVQPVPDHVLRAALAAATGALRDMMLLQLLTGMRPGELLALRPADVDRAADPWVYRPEHHKSRHRGHDRTVFIGPQAQAVLSPHLFRAEAERCFPMRVDSYCHAVHRLCHQHGLPRFHPHQLRHNAATAVRAEFGPDAARALLGHHSLNAVAIYAELSAEKAAQVAKKIG